MTAGQLGALAGLGTFLLGALVLLVRVVSLISGISVNQRVTTEAVARLQTRMDAIESEHWRRA